METNPLTQQTTRDFSTISPSAYSLLLMKGLTAIPYAREAAAFLLNARPDIANVFKSRPGNPPAANPSNSNPFRQNPTTTNPTGQDPSNPRTSGTNPSNPFPSDTEQRPPLFWARLMHFENRYWSINQLMQSLDITNILELSSGFSFRGLDLSRQKPVHYIDTDLPDLIATKKQFVEALTGEHPPADSSAPTHNPANATADSPTVRLSKPGHYELRALNVLDEHAFDAIVDSFPPGELLIVNEGLLVYLDQAEKETLCRTIRKALQRRGGYWITGDVYIQKELDPSLIDREDSFHQFLQQHNIEEKKFRDFESAAEFFTRMGFIIDREAITDVSKLSAWPRLFSTITPEIQKKLTHAPKMHAIWRLRVNS